MITAVDSSVVIDVFSSHPQFGASSARALSGWRSRGQLIASEVVLAEVAAGFNSAELARRALSGLGVELVSIGADAATIAGLAWSTYRARGGPRSRLIPNFLIGGHAQVHSDQLLTRDRGFYRSYFGGLAVVQP